MDRSLPSDFPHVCSAGFFKNCEEKLQEVSVVDKLQEVLAEKFNLSSFFLCFTDFGENVYADTHDTLNYFLLFHLIQSTTWRYVNNSQKFDKEMFGSFGRLLN